MCYAKEREPVAIPNFGISKLYSGLIPCYEIKRESKSAGKMREKCGNAENLSFQDFLFPSLAGEDLIHCSLLCPAMPAASTTTSIAMDISPELLHG